MADSTLQGLSNILSNPAAGDLLLAADISDGNMPKKLPLSTLLTFVMNNNNSFTIGSGFELLQNMDANEHKITGLAAGSADGDSVNYSQVKAGIMSLAAIIPTVPSVSDNGAFLRIVTPTISNPWGGFYLFYWCVDTNSSTQITQTSGNVVASSGASVYFDGSVANVVNVIKDSGWAGKWFHVAVMYRNISSRSEISATGHLHVENHIFGDVIREDPPARAENIAITSSGNRLYIIADRPLAGMPGDSYMLELMFDNKADTEITGNEVGLVRASSSTPDFTYDIPLSSGKDTYAHARIISKSLWGNTNETITVHCGFTIDTDVLNDTMLNYLALKVAGLVTTNSGEPLKMK